MSMLDGSWINPFKSEQQDLVCLSTGKLAVPEIQKYFLWAEALREKAYATFKKDRLKSEPPKVKFCDNLLLRSMHEEADTRVLLHAAVFWSSLVSTNESHFNERVSFRQSRLISILEQTSLVESRLSSDSWIVTIKNRVVSQKPWVIQIISGTRNWTAKLVTSRSQPSKQVLIAFACQLSMADTKKNCEIHSCNYSSANFAKGLFKS